MSRLSLYFFLRLCLFFLKFCILDWSFLLVSAFVMTICNILKNRSKVAIENEANFTYFVLIYQLYPRLDTLNRLLQTENLLQVKFRFNIIQENHYQTVFSASLWSKLHVRGL